MKIPLIQVDAFASDPFHGNPAAVCFLDAWLPDAILQAIALENNLSETAFTVPTDNGFELRWFTPKDEVPLCGHATMGAAKALFDSERVVSDRITFQTRSSGQLMVHRDEQLLWMDFPNLPASPCEIPDQAQEALGTKILSARTHNYLFLELQNEEQLRSIVPRQDLIASISDYAVCLTAPSDEFDFVSRLFAPLKGIPEDPVTGSTHCSLAPFWASKIGKTSLTAYQASPRGGVVRCELKNDRVLIGGSAVVVLRGTLTI